MVSKDVDMPFGKHKGEWICDIPTAYLRWLIENCDELNTSLRNHVANELGFREANNRHSRGQEDRQQFLAEDEPVESPKKETIKGREEVIRHAIQAWHGSVTAKLRKDQKTSDLNAVNRAAAELVRQLQNAGLKVDLRL